MLEERLRFVVAASRKEKAMQDLCREFGVSRQTGYVWLRRYQAGGSTELVDRSRRPQTSPRQTSPEVEQAVVGLRARWPDWGAPKLAKVLEQQGTAVKVRTLQRILDRHGLIVEDDRRPQARQRFERAAPNELWQMDFKGPQGFNRGSGVGPLSVLDDHSRYLLALHHLGSTRMEGVKNTLEGVFQRCGMPEMMLMDHGTPWWNAASPWGLTELSVWIMRLGIRLTYSGVRHPQTQGKVERMHGALQRAVRKRKTNPEDQAWLDEFRQEYNHVRPHEALAMAVPASRWRPSSTPLPNPIQEWEYPSHLKVCQLAEQGQLRWGRRRYDISMALRGLRVGVEELESRLIVYFCRTPLREVDLSNGRAIALPIGPIRSLAH